MMESITRFITTKLKLKVNQQKSAVARPWARKFLGFSFTSAGVPKRRIAPKAVDRFKERVRELTRRTKGVGIERMVEDLARYERGWIGCRVGGGALARWPPSAAQTVRAVFPHTAFTKTHASGGQSKGSTESSSPARTRRTTWFPATVASHRSATA